VKYGRYEVVKELGKGAMGVVYKAHDPQIDRMIALKVLREDRVTSHEFVQRFLKEAMAIGRLSHPNIVTVYDVGSDHGTVFIAEEFIEGKPVDEILKQGRLEIRQVIQFGIQMADALDYAHKRGIVHRDIKPSNILIMSEGQIKITDFGIARIEDPNAPQLTHAGEILGTPYYMSPEQLMGRTIDGRSDIFSLGVILYEMSSGKRPFSGKSLPSIFHEITEKVPDSPKSLEGKIPDHLSTLILKALEKNPENRYSTGKELSEALKSIELKNETHGREKHKTKRIKSKASLIGVLALVLTVFTIAIYSWISISHEFAVIKLESEPEGAQVFLNGDLKGLTPLDLEVPLGKYELRLNKQNYYEWEAQIQIEEEGHRPIFVKLNPISF
jgi:eukaryotic-like serine/threonine-protein kinase